jgi:hypothetical protein
LNFKRTLKARKNKIVWIKKNSKKALLRNNNQRALSRKTKISGNKTYYRKNLTRNQYSERGGLS